MSSTRVWTCDRCGTSEPVPHRKQYGCAPAGWALVVVTTHAGGAGDATDTNVIRDLCRECADRIRAALVAS